MRILRENRRNKRKQNFSNYKLTIKTNKMKKLKLIKSATIIFLLFTCAASARETTLEEKKAWAKRSCDGLNLKYQACYDEQVDFAPKYTN